MENLTEIKYHGKKESLPFQRVLSAGDLKVIYEGGNLRHIAFDGIEVIRMIYAAVRDGTWLTASPEITEEVIEDMANSFKVSYHCRYRLNDIDFKAVYTITGTPKGHITFEMDGEALSTFRKNRIGFCVLHPVEGVAGQDCHIVHPDGREEVQPFPKYIRPDNLFLDIRSMKWEISKNAIAELIFYGDIFETEDQRNWTDASFKTYCTPLKILHPAEVKKGTRIHQKVELMISGHPAEIVPSDHVVQIQFVQNEINAFPELGIGRSTRDHLLKQEDAWFLKKLHLSHYRADLYLFNPDWEGVFENALHEAEMLRCPLELALFFGDDPQQEAEKFVNLLKTGDVNIKRIFLFHKDIQATEDKLIEILVPVLRRHIPDARIFAGTNCNFAQLNRKRPGTSLIDGLVFAIHPQEHANDNLTLVENLKAQAYAVASLQQFANGKKIAVSPVTIQRRFNANVGNFETMTESDEIPWQVDPRQMSLFGGGWTAISFKYLAESGIDSVTYYETTGERGIQMGSRSSRWPGQFYADKDIFFPLFHVLAFISHHQKAEIMKSISSDPLAADALCLKDKDGLGMGIILVNFNLVPQTVRIAGLNHSIRILPLDENTYDEAVKNNDWLIQAHWEKQQSAGKDLEFTLAPLSVLFIRA